MSEVNAVEGAGEGNSTGGENAELTNALETGATGADQGSEAAVESGAESSGAEGGEGSEGGSEGGGEGAPPSGDDSVNKEINKLTRKLSETHKREREANENLRRALEALERANGGKKPEPTPTATEPADDIGPEPEPPIFEDPEQYQRDMALYTQKVVERTTKMQLKAVETQRQTKAQEEANRAAQIAHAQAWQARRTKALEEMPDYAEVAENPSIHISQHMMIGITSSDNGPKLAYHLGQHPEVAERIAKMHPAMQLIELGKLEAQITAPKPPKVSNAPPPIRHQTGSGSPQVKSADEMSMEEYAASRSKH